MCKPFDVNCAKIAVVIFWSGRKKAVLLHKISETMKKLSVILCAIMAFVMPSCAQKNVKSQMSNQKSIVVFFSHAGENYAVGNIKVGNTKIVADYISELTGADQAEIVTHKYDGMAYTPLTNLAQDEQNNDELPEFELVPNVDFSQYDTIFIGGPIWWGTYPQVMFTFFGRYDLNGKTIYPFTTHEGSGLGSAVSDVRRAYPNASVQKGFSIYGHEVRSNKAKVENWLKNL